MAHMAYTEARATANMSQRTLIIRFSSSRLLSRPVP